MKKTFIFIFILFLCYAASAQNWRKNLPQNKTKSELTLPDYQKAFNDYWDSFNVKNGRYVDAKGKEHKAYGWKQFKRWEYFWSSRVNPVTGEFPKTTAYEQVQKFYNSQNIPKSANGNWTSLGTSYSDGGYAGIGRLASIAFHPTNDQIFWVGAPAGGLWVTTNGGAEWNALTDNNGVLGVSSIVIPSDYDASHTIYIGTGDRDASDNNSIGVLKSTDSGLTWNTTGLVFEASQEKQIGAMLMLPGNNQTIFAATTSGLYKTIDGATNWDLLTNLNFIDIEFKPDNLTVMYGSTRNGKIYKSESVRRQQSLQSGGLE